MAALPLSFPECLILEPLVLQDLDNSNPEMQLRNLLKIIQQMWTGIQNVLSFPLYQEKTHRIGLMTNEEKTDFSRMGKCYSDPHSVLRCYTSRVMLNYIFKEVAKEPSTERMELADETGNDPGEITIITYNLGGPQFPDHTFITIQTRESFYLLQSFYLQYSFGSLYGLIKLNAGQKVLFDQIIDGYKHFNRSYLITDNSKSQLKDINDAFKTFTGIDTDSHLDYQANITQMINANNDSIRRGGQPLYYNEINETKRTFPLSFYCGSLKLKIYSMLQLISELYQRQGFVATNPKIHQWHLYQSYLINPLLGNLNDTSLSVYSGYENIVEVQINGGTLNIKYETNGRWIKQFYFYVTQISRIFKHPVYDFENKNFIQICLHYDAIMSEVSRNTAILENALGCNSISIVKNNTLDTSHGEDCERCIGYSANEALSRILNIPVQDTAEDFQNKQIIASLSFRSVRKTSRKTYRKASRKTSKKTRKSVRKASRKTSKKTRKSVRKTSKKTRKSVRKTSKKTRK
jgi:hypothetical protein